MGNINAVAILFIRQMSETFDVSLANPTRCLHNDARCLVALQLQNQKLRFLAAIRPTQQ